MTIRDIATKAQVSTATVDRVLNRRAGASAANRQRVIEAARDLGYLPSEGGILLPSRPAHLEFFIPFVTNGFMRELVQRLTTFASQSPLVASCKVTALEGIGPDTLVAALERVSLGTSGVGLVAIDHPKTRRAIRRLCDSGLRVVTIASDVLSTPRSAYIGVDNFVAGRTAGLLMGLMSGGRAGAIGLFVGSRAFHGHRERETSFRTILEDRFPNVRILPPVETGEDSARSRSAMQTLLRTTPDLVGIYCVGAGRTGIAEAIRARATPGRPFVVMHDLTDSTRAWLAEDIIDAVIDQNARFVAEQAVMRLLGAIAINGRIPSPKEVEPRIILRENVPMA